MADTPYSNLPAEAFWKSAVAERSLDQLQGLWTPKFGVTPKTRVATYGSCFAQHFGASLRARDYGWMEAEAPPYGLPGQKARNFGYGLFSSRTGNIYTATMLEQWGAWAFGKAEMPKEVWQRDERFFDPFRPRIEPEGFANSGELDRCRDTTLAAFRTSVTRADLFVFTLGLTERWVNADQGYEYAMCPGTAAGTYQPEQHVFDNLRVDAVIAAMERSIALFRGENPGLRFLLTVSPVPLTATASGRHVLVATMESKAILRTAAAEVAANHEFVDYFPSYEIVTNPVFGHGFFAPNRRSVSEDGVAYVMETFFDGQAKAFGVAVPPAKTANDRAADVVCEEELLESFGDRS